MTEEIKKTTVRGRKPATKVDESEVASVTEKVKVEKESVVEKRQIQDTDRILVMNNTTGIYGYYGTNGYSFDLESYGQTITIPFAELRTMASGQHRKHLTEAWLVILDEDVIEELNLGKVYENIYTQSEVDELLKKPDVIKEVFPNMTKAMKTTFVTRARQLIKHEQLTDFRVIRAVEELSKVNITE